MIARTRRANAMIARAPPPQSAIHSYHGRRSMNARPAGRGRSISGETAALSSLGDGSAAEAGSSTGGGTSKDAAWLSENASAPGYAKGGESASTVSPALWGSAASAGSSATEG